MNYIFLNEQKCKEGTCAYFQEMPIVGYQYSDKDIPKYSIEKIYDAMYNGEGSILCGFRSINENVIQVEKMISMKTILDDYARLCAATVCEYWEPNEVVIEFLKKGTSELRKEVIKELFSTQEQDNHTNDSNSIAKDATRYAAMIYDDAGDDPYIARAVRSSNAVAECQGVRACEIMENKIKEKQVCARQNWEEIYKHMFGLASSALAFVFKDIVEKKLAM